MVLLEVNQLLSQALDLHLKVRPGHGQLVQNLSETGDISLDRRAHGKLILEPAQVEGKKSSGHWHQAVANAVEYMSHNDNILNSI